VTSLLADCPFFVMQGAMILNVVLIIVVTSGIKRWPGKNALAFRTSASMTIKKKVFIALTTDGTTL
jgi:hypothetical protein